MHSFSPDYVLVRPLETTGDHQGPRLGKNSPPTICHGDLEESFGISDDSLFQRNVQDNDAGRPNNWSPNNPTSEDSSTMKKRKLSHNAYERDRRKKTNALYSSLRSLLPETDRLHKRLSIPGTVSRVLQYIPELQRQVERLKRRKEEIKKSKLIPKAEDKTLPTYAVEGVRPAISVSVLGVREMGIQIICSCGKGSRGRRESRLSDILDYLEGKGLGLVRASSLAMGDDRALHNLHLQVKNGFSDVMDPGRVSKNLRSILS